MVIGQAAIEFFQKRGIGLDTVEKLGIYTASQGQPDPDGAAICFPFFENGTSVNEKYRHATEKRFHQRKGGRRTFWNSAILDEVALTAGAKALIITEGEVDALTAIECGFPHAVSVPDGAPAVRPGEKATDLRAIDEGAEQAGKFAFMWNNIDRLKRIKRFVIATDNDPPGQRLAAELVRRLSESKCSFVVYPSDCKDLNDVLVKHGQDMVRQVLDQAKPYPVRGLHKIRDYPDVDFQLFSTNWPGMDPYLHLWIGELVVITGVPNHGKSTFALNLVYNMAKLHGWGTVMCTPEMQVKPHIQDMMRGIHGGTDDEVDDFLQTYFSFIDDDPNTSERDYDVTLDWVLEKAEDAVLRDGVRILLIDPWNEIEHARGRNEMITDYVGRSLRKMKKFAKRFGLVVIVVAHPTKDVWREGKTSIPSLYDIEGSAHWYNKCDLGLVLSVPDFSKVPSPTRVTVAKVRFQRTGRRGEVWMNYDRATYRFTDGSKPEEK